jgi:hypothetical protein
VAQREGSAKVTTNHDTIRRWVEARGGCPATVKRTGGRGDPGLLRIDFPGYSGRTTLAPLEWDAFFQKFDESNLAFLYQEKTAQGKPSRFVKLIRREDARRRGAESRARAASTGSRGKAGGRRSSQDAGSQRGASGRRSSQDGGSQRAVSGRRSKQEGASERATSGRRATRATARTRSGQSSSKRTSARGGQTRPAGQGGSRKSGRQGSTRSKAR